MKALNAILCFVFVNSQITVSILLLHFINENYEKYSFMKKTRLKPNKKLDFESKTYDEKYYNFYPHI